MQVCLQVCATEISIMTESRSAGPLRASSCSKTWEDIDHLRGDCDYAALLVPAGFWWQMVNLSARPKCLILGGGCCQAHLPSPYSAHISALIRGFSSPLRPVGCEPQLLSWHGAQPQLPTPLSPVPLPQASLLTLNIM